MLQVIGFWLISVGLVIVVGGAWCSSIGPLGPGWAW
jgi:hypothetical protein